jgi:3-isopropylmalate/(R)-2-methylmalate dehydratase small subunit
MERFSQLTANLLPLPYQDVDTDQIIPASYLKVTSKNGLDEGLFASWSRRQDGGLRPDFPLNQAKYQGAQIMLVGDNFGCGSSREHAAWAILGRGFRAIIGTSFADIFHNNALKNGLLPVTLDIGTVRELFSMVEQDPATRVTIQLAEQSLLLPDGRLVNFPIDAFSKGCLLQGLDQLAYLLEHEREITSFEREVETRSLE